MRTAPNQSSKHLQTPLHVVLLTEFHATLSIVHAPISEFEFTSFSPLLKAGEPASRSMAGRAYSGRDVFLDRNTSPTTGVVSSEHVDGASVCELYSCLYLLATSHLCLPVCSIA